jgi:hypothetical protein
MKPLFDPARGMAHMEVPMEPRQTFRQVALPVFIGDSAQAWLAPMESTRVPYKGRFASWAMSRARISRSNTGLADTTAKVDEVIE